MKKKIGQFLKIVNQAQHCLLNEQLYPVRIGRRVLSIELIPKLQLNRKQIYPKNGKLVFSTVCDVAIIFINLEQKKSFWTTICYFHWIDRLFFWMFSLHWFLFTPSSGNRVKQYNTHIRHFVNARRHYTSKWIETTRQYNNRPVYIYCSEKYGYALINTALFQRDSLVARFWYICQFFALLCVFRFQFFVKETYGFKTCSQCCLSFQAHRQ